ncbi:MAG: methionyl-tRNA formyltransferase [Bacteroidota bacterium]
MKTFPRIVFFGTPDFAVASLEKLVATGFSIVAVVTAPDKPAGRGLKAKCSPVKEFAMLHSIPVLQPLNMKDQQFFEQLNLFKPDLQIVIAFRMIPKQIWSLPPLGTFNLHASLLPQYRGAAPINRAIINGESETGVTTFYLNEQIDSGKIILSEKAPIHPYETAGELHDKLMKTGSELVIRTVKEIISGNFREASQEKEVDLSAPLKTAPKIFREDCLINWNQNVSMVYNFIRGLSPYPGAYTYLIMPDGTKQTLKILRAVPENFDSRIVPGKFITDGKTYIKIGAENGFIHLEELQLPGRKAMNSVDFLNGFSWIFPETRAI